MTLLPLGFAITVTDANLLGYWNLNEVSGVTAIDSYSGAYNGVNTTTYPTLGYAGVIGTGYDYNGGKTAISSLTQLTSTMAIALWYKGTDTTGATYMVLKRLALNGSGETTNYSYFLGSYQGKVWAQRAFSAGTIAIQGSSNVNDGAWHFIVFDHNATGLSIFVDGVLETYQTNANPIFVRVFSSDGQFNSDDYQLLVNRSNSKLDEIAIFKRDLNSVEITSLYNGGAGQTYCPSTNNFLATCDLSIRNVSIRVKDEDTWIDMNNVAITIDGNTSTIVSGGRVDINFVGKSDGWYIATFTANDYVTDVYRFYYADASININFAMLKENKSLLTRFKFKGVGVNTYLANGWQTMFKLSPYTYDLYYTSSTLTDSLGEAYISIDGNSQQYYTILSSSEFSYPIPLTINIPKDEMTDLNISDANFTINMTNTYNFYDNRLTSKVLYLVPNTYDYVFIGIDSNNTNYTERTYFVRYDSDDATSFESTHILQPYLPKGADIFADGPIFITKTSTRDTLPYIDFFIYKTINSEKQQIMSARTDITGSRLFPFIIGENYKIDVARDYNTRFISSYLYTATATPVWWYLTLTENIDINQYFVETFLTFNPAGPKLGGAVNSITATMSADNLVRYSWQFFQYNDLNKLTGKKFFTNGGGVCASNTCSAVMAIPTMDTNKSFFIDMNWSYNNGDTNSRTIREFSKTAASNMDVFRLAFNVRKDFGCTLDYNSICALGMILSIVISVIALFAITRFVGIFFGLGSLVLVMLFLGLFTYVGWFFWPLYIFLLVAAVLTGASGFLRGGGNV
jgi:hypothetical protein